MYHVYRYLDVEPSLPLVSTFHLPLPVSGARLQALTTTVCASRVLSALQMPVSLVSLPGTLGWWAPLLRLPESWPLPLLGVGRVNGKPSCMVSGVSRAVTKPCRLYCCGWGPLYWTPSSTKSPSTVLIQVPVTALQDYCNGLENGLSYFVQVHVQSIFHPAAEEILLKYKWEQIPPLPQAPISQQESCNSLWSTFPSPEFNPPSLPLYCSHTVTLLFLKTSCCPFTLWSILVADLSN